METILDVLKTLGKATAREVAAQMKIETAEVLGMLREHESAGLAGQMNGYWQLVEAKRIPQTELTVKRVKPAAAARIKMNEKLLLALLDEHGTLTSEQMAGLLGTTVRAVASTLAMPVNKGRVVREKKGSVFYFSRTAAAEPAVKEILPAAGQLILAAPAPAPAPAQQNAAAFLETIPQMVPERAASVVLTPKFIAGEIRKTKCRLARLEDLRITVRTLARQQRCLGL